MSDQNDELLTPGLLDTALIERRKTPVVLQSEAMECGLASLCMVMATFGRNLDLTILRERYPASMRGVSIARLGEIAEQEGFLLTAYQAQADQMAELKLPGVLHWKGNHFVVLTEYKAGKSVTLHDPAIGLRKLTWEDFVEGFSGACCELEPLATMKKEVKKQRLSVFTLLKKTHGYGAMLLKMGVVALLLEILLMVSPMFLQTVVDEVIPVGDDKLLWSLAIGFAGVAIFKAAVNLVHGWLGMALTGMLAMVMKVMTFRHLLRLPLTWFEKRGVGTVTARFGSLHRMREVLSDNVLLALVDSLVAIVMVAVLLLYEWRLALITFVVAALSFTATYFLFKRYQLAASEGVLADAEENRVLVETVGAIPAVKMFGQELRQLQNYRMRVVESTNRMLGMLRVKTWHSSVQMLLSAVGDVVIVASASLLVLQGSLSLGVMFGFYAYKQILADKVTALANAYFNFRLLSVYSDAVADVLLSPEEETASKKLNVGAQPALHFENVCFTYDEADHPTLDNFCLTVKPGEVVAVTGPSGGGKSTLVKLLTGSLKPSRGSIRLDNEELVGVPPASVREHLGVVLQQDHLLTGTLLENITMFESNPDMERVHQAVKDAAFQEVVDSIPTGLNTFILGHAPTLSGGQKQRLTLARAFYKNAAVLVLDEATSALDVEREIHVCDAIRRKGMTTLMVAHRQETLARCDRVVVVGG
jgi:ATP-binding cassette, subfamily B, bacterial CvaB/MchF/RaxB